MFGTDRRTVLTHSPNLHAKQSRRWVNRVLITTLTGESPAELRLTWKLDRAARKNLETELFGKRLLVTDHDDWTIADVVTGYRSQNDVESGFRQLEDPHVVGFSPIFHWTDSQIRVRGNSPALPHRQQGPAPSPTHPHRPRPHPAAPVPALQPRAVRTTTLTWIIQPINAHTPADLHVCNSRPRQPGNSR